MVVSKTARGGSNPSAPVAGGKTAQRDDEALCRAGKRYSVEPYLGLALFRRPAMKSAGYLVGTTEY